MYCQFPAGVFDIAANRERSKNIMKFVSFNIQYGVGLDGVCDPERIAVAVRGADIIALQEVSRNLPKNSQADLPAIFSDLLSGYFPAFGAGVDTDAGSEIVHGKAVVRRVQFGNMILSRHPILAIRNILLPRSRTYGMLNIQRSALEALIATPVGPIRVYSVHLDHSSPAERMAQIEFLRGRATLYGVEGGSVSGTSELGFPETPHTDDFVIMGDFNMLPESPEYIAMAGPKDVYYGRTPRANQPTDALGHLGKRGSDAFTWEEPGHPEIRQYLDYCFVSGSLVHRLKNGWVDDACIASDHKPVWLELD
jgi:endonuclease/exonuclease/phosphatase family metal-dependent hydrolase